MSAMLRHAFALCLVRLAPIRDRWVWFALSMLITLFVGGTLPALADLAPASLTQERSAWIPSAGPWTPPSEPGASAERVARTWPAEDWVVGPGTPAWTGLVEQPSHRSQVRVEPDRPRPAARPRLAVSSEDEQLVADALILLRRVRDVADAEARAALGVTADPRRAIGIWQVDVPRAAPRGLPSPDGVGALLLGVALLHGLGLLAAGLPRWRSRGFHATLRVSPVRPLAVLFGGLFAALVGGGLAAGVALLGWWGNALMRGGSVDLALHHLLVPVALLPGLALAQRAFLTAPDTRSAGFRVIGLQMALGGLSAAWLFAVAGGGLLVGAAVPFVGLFSLATGVAPVQPGALAVGLASGLGTTALALFSSARTLANDPVEAGDPTLRRRARGNHLPEVALLLLLAVGGTTTFTLPLQHMGMAVGLVVGQLGFILLPSIVMPLALSRPMGPLLGLSRPPGRAWLAAPVVMVGAVALSMLALIGSAWALGGDDLGEGQALASRLQALSAGPGLLLLTLLPALCEEVLFRGSVLGLLRLRLPTWAAVLLQALAFALLHGMALRVAPTLALGLVLGLLRVRTGSLWPGVLVHALHNAVLLVVPMLGLDPFALPPGALAGGAALAAVLGLLAAWRSGPPRS
jgi:membrane protease YdiL (CAAX protease family)